MRRTQLNGAYVILDEAQNTTPEQMKMFLTRIGFGAKAVITGDISQIDLPRHIKSGLKDAKEKLAGHRRPLFPHFHQRKRGAPSAGARKIVEAYDAADEQAQHTERIIMSLLLSILVLIVALSTYSSCGLEITVPSHPEPRARVQHQLQKNCSSPKSAPICQPRPLTTAFSPPA